MSWVLRCAVIAGLFGYPVAVLGADPSESGPPIHFYADLSPDEESHVVESPAKGRIDFMLERATLKFTWKLTYTGLTSPPTGAHMHGPQTPGGNAGILIDLAPDGVKNPLEGSITLNEGALEYLLDGRTYTNVHTSKYPDGEIRGPILRMRPENEKN